MRTAVLGVAPPTTSGASGKETDSVSLGQFYSRPEQLEVQDVRFADGVLYFNAAAPERARTRITLLTRLARSHFTV